MLKTDRKMNNSSKRLTGSDLGLPTTTHDSMTYHEGNPFHQRIDNSVGATKASNMIQQRHIHPSGNSRPISMADNGAVNNDTTTRYRTNSVHDSIHTVSSYTGSKRKRSNNGRTSSFDTSRTAPPIETQLAYNTTRSTVKPNMQQTHKISTTKRSMNLQQAHSASTNAPPSQTHTSSTNPQPQQTHNASIQLIDKGTISEQLKEEKERLNDIRKARALQMNRLEELKHARSELEQQIEFVQSRIQIYDRKLILHEQEISTLQGFINGKLNGHITSASSPKQSSIDTQTSSSAGVHSGLRKEKGRLTMLQDNKEMDGRMNTLVSKDQTEEWDEGHVLHDSAAITDIHSSYDGKQRKPLAIQPPPPLATIPKHPPISVYERDAFDRIPRAVWCDPHQVGHVWSVSCSGQVRCSDLPMVGAPDAISKTVLQLRMPAPPSRSNGSCSKYTLSSANFSSDGQYIALCPSIPASNKTIDSNLIVLNTQSVQTNYNTQSSWQQTDVPTSPLQSITKHFHVLVDCSKTFCRADAIMAKCQAGGLSSTAWYTPNANESLLATACLADHSVALWRGFGNGDQTYSKISCDKLHTLHRSVVQDLSFSADGKQLATTGNDGILAWFDFEAMRPTMIWPFGRSPNSKLKFDGILKNEMPSFVNRNSFLDIGEKLHVSSSSIFSQLALSVMMNQSDGGVLRSNCVRQRPHTSSDWLSSFLSRDAQMLVLMDTRSPRPNALFHWRRPKNTPAFRSAIKPSWSADGNFIACGGPTEEIHIWDVRMATPASHGQLQSISPHISIQLSQTGKASRAAVLSAQWTPSRQWGASIVTSISDRRIGWHTFA